MSTSTTGTGRFIQYWAYPDQIHLSTFAIGNNRLTFGDSAALGIDRVVTSAIGSIVTSVPARGEVYSIQVRQLLARGRDSLFCIRTSSTNYTIHDDIAVQCC